MARTPKQSGGRASYPASRGDLLRLLSRNGWTITTTGGGHTRATPPHGGPWVVFPSTGSDVQGIQRTCADIRRVTGIDVRKLR